MAQPPDRIPVSEAKAAVSGRIPVSEAEAAVSFLKDVKARLTSDDPAVYHEFLRILRAVKTGENPDRGKAVDDVHALLRGHPDLVRRFDAFIPDELAPERTRPKRERRPTPTAAVADHAHARIGRALRYFERVKEAGLYDSLLALLFRVRPEGEQDVNEIYHGARRVFGSAHGDLLREFTDEYLPVLKGRERDDLLKVKGRAKEPHPEEHRAPAPKRKAAAAVAADKPSAAKRPRGDERKTTNRRANSPAVVDATPKSGGVFREAWEFETTYTKLVATARRTKELLEQYESPKDAPPPRGRRAFEELFPSREWQEVLREMYRGMLGRIREALEDGARTELALRTIKRRLGMLEQAAVKMAMERRDRARVEGRMQKLAFDRVLVLRKEQARAARRHLIARGEPDAHSVKYTEVGQPTLVLC